VTPGAYDVIFNGNTDVFVFKLVPAGGGNADLLYSTFVGGYMGELAYGIALDSTNKAYVTGFTLSGNFPTTPGAYDTVYNFNYDAFVFKLKLEAVSGAKALKTEAKDILKGIETNDEKLQKKLDKAIKHIDKSLGLDPKKGDKNSMLDVWEDDNHLDKKKGKKVFDEEKKAVKELSKLVKKDGDRQLNSALMTAIGKLVQADVMLADTVFQEAVYYDETLGNDDPWDNKLDKCEKEMGKVKEELAKGKYDKAIDHCKKVWEESQKILKMQSEAVPHDDDTQDANVD
jgi:hypothetical protein